MICPECRVFVKNIGKHNRRNRCEAQHHRGGYYPSGAKGGGGQVVKKTKSFAEKVKDKIKRDKQE